MPTRETAPVGAPCWVDLMTSDTARSREFYGQLFGWSAGEPAEEFGGYFMLTRDGVNVAGCTGSQADTGGPDVWTVYLTTDDAQKAVDAAAANGGRVHVGPMPVGDLGAMAVVADPDGAVIGIWQPGHFPGFRVIDEPGAPSWFELHTRDYEAALAFYRDVFGWDVQVVGDTPEFRYSVLRLGENWLAGIMDASGFLPAGKPSHWSVYFSVEDTDVALEDVVRLGGSILLPAEDTPYGRLAAVEDPTGAQFKLVGPNAAMPAAGTSTSSA